jgi:hypothetical protein
MVRKAFKQGLKLGRGAMISTLVMRVFHLATNDGSHSFQACAFLLRTWGRPQWRCRRMPIRSRRLRLRQCGAREWREALPAA